MSTSANRKMFSFQPGVVIKPLYDKCPACGCRLDEFYQTVSDEGNSGDIKKQTDKARSPASVDAFKWWHPIASWYFFFVHRMVHPFGNSEDDAPKADYKSFPNRIVTKNTSTVQKQDKNAEYNKHFVPSVKRKLR